MAVSPSPYPAPSGPPARRRELTSRRDVRRAVSGAGRSASNRSAGQRLAFGVMGTVSGLVLVFSYHTSRSAGGGALGAGAGQPDAGLSVAASDPAAPASGAIGQQLTGGRPAPGNPGARRAAPSPSRRPSPSPRRRASSLAAGADRGVSGTFTGKVAKTRWGPVQVRVVLRAGTITSATVLQRPSSHQVSQEINAYALPRLTAQALRASSAKIDGVSGATVTSNGYRTSLQSALDQAHG